MKVNDIIVKLAKNPGLTRRNAQKLLFNFIRNKEKIDEFAQILQTVKEDIRTCENCYNIAFNKLCFICENDKRDKATVCIVEDFEDVVNLEKGLWYNGIYYVLGGLLSAQKGMMPDDLNTKKLFEKIHNEEISEIIFASTSSFEWQATMHFLNIEMQKIPNFKNVKVTEFAHGLPIGSSFEFMDEGTLQIAFNGRKTLI